ncbi:MAG: Ldh family oxidoreductase [Candidatus Omnitrophica bacterium]|nr:Ldh family oxidoreductase [Candidatus Omnitrophota bacterium]MDD5736840.1 Ldh family oxidoreductase [Candidatus Omnitrophota bacterium]
MEGISVKADQLKSFAKDSLLKAGVREDVSEYVSEGLVQTSLRGVDSHGIRLLPHYLAAVKGGRINPDPNYKFKKTSASTGMLDADHTFGHAAGMEAVKKAVKLAEDAGSGHIAVYNSTHFGAAAYYALEIAKHDMIGFSFTHADSLMKTYGGNRAFLGTNPISFAAPIYGEEPFCLDMATTLFNFNKIKQMREKELKAPAGAGADSEGMDTTDPNEITMLLPAGGYKGYGLSFMIEVLCSMLTGMPYGPQISKMFAAPLSEKRLLGHFMIALRIDCFQEKEAFKKRMKRMADELRSEPVMKGVDRIRIAGDPEKEAFAKRTESGIPLSHAEARLLKAIADEYDTRLKI